MNAVFSSVLDMSIGSCWVILAVLAARLLLRKAPAAARFVLWALVALRLICPVTIESNLSLVPRTPPVSYAQAQLGIAVQVEVPEAAPPTVPVWQYIEPANTVEHTSEAAFTLTPVPIWLAGTAVLALWAAVSYLRLTFRVRSALRWKDNVYRCDHIPSPFLLGLFRPRIYLPSELDQEQLPYVLAHESAHLKRLDHVWKLLGYCLLTLHWFNPLVWLSYVLMCRDLELACDERVIRDMGKGEIRKYSEALIACSVPRHLLAACPLAFGEVGVKTRIKNILHYKKPALWIILAALVVTAVVAVCFLTEPKAEAVPEETPPPEASLRETIPVEEDAPETTPAESPYDMVASLEPEGARASADFLIRGGGYNFFNYEAQELVGILNALQPENFSVSPAISPDTAITLRASGREIVLTSDGNVVGVHHNSIFWAVESEALKDFFATINSMTDYEVYNVAPLEELRRNYSVEEAIIDRCVVHIDGDLRDNAQVWNEFYAACQQGQSATVRLLYSSDGEKQIHDLSYDGERYTLSWYENGELSRKTYHYLHRFTGESGDSGAAYDAYDRFILTDEAACTWDDRNHTLRRSGSSDAADHHVVCTDLTYYPLRPNIPAGLTEVTLELEGKVLVSITDPDYLEKFHSLFLGAEETYEPKTYSLGPELVFHFASGTIAAQLELNNDLCVIDGIFYDYGPGYDDDGSLNNLPRLLELLSLTQWPGEVYDRFGAYIAGIYN